MVIGSVWVMASMWVRRGTYDYHSLIKDRQAVRYDVVKLQYLDLLMIHVFGG